MSVTWTNVPGLKTVDDVAEYLGISRKYLRWLLCNVDTQYRKLELPKSDGTKRVVYAPSFALKKVLKKLQSLFKLVEFPAHVGAYVLGRGCKHTAQQHTKSSEVISLDLKDFFGTVPAGRIRSALLNSGKIGYAPAAVISKLTTLKGYAPQGSPTSGDVCNIVACFYLDPSIHRLLGNLSRRILTVPNHEKFHSLSLNDIQDAVIGGTNLRAGGPSKKFFFSEALKWKYTRYSDDIDVSCDQKLPRAVVNYVIYKLYCTLQTAGFQTNFKKTKVERKGNRQVILGMVVNEHTNVPIARYKKYRAIIHNVLKNGYIAEMSRAGFDDPLKFHMHLQGVINYFGQVNQAKKNNLVDNLKSAKRLWKAELDSHQ